MPSLVKLPYFFIHQVDKAAGHHGEHDALYNRVFPGGEHSRGAPKSPETTTGWSAPPNLNLSKPRSCWMSSTTPCLANVALSLPYVHFSPSRTSLFSPHD